MNQLPQYPFVWVDFHLQRRKWLAKEKRFEVDIPNRIYFISDTGIKVFDGNAVEPL